MPCEVEYASEFRYRNGVIEPRTMVIAISQSGETADTLAALRESKRRGAMPLGIVNVVGSSIARECGRGVYLHAGPEFGVAATKSFTNQVVSLLLIAVHFARKNGMSLRQGMELLNAIERLPDLAEETMSRFDLCEEICREYVGSDNFLYIGRAMEYPVALEGALKLKEVSYIHAEGLPAAELKHGPIALITPETPTVVTATQSFILDKVSNNVQEIKARGGKIIAITCEASKQLNPLADQIITVPLADDLLSPILAVIPAQMIAYHLAVLRGCDVDQPRNLAKSVTVE
jgi:glucosamine--fructose-6-phosphate aminotransferase (isomerizing)